MLVFIYNAVQSQNKKCLYADKMRNADFQIAIIVKIVVDIVF